MASLTMIRFPLQIIFILAMLLVCKSNALVIGESTIRCVEEERQALLKIKESLVELKHGFLSSWGDEEEKRECCEWHGVRCSNQSGHVTKLDLSPTHLQLGDDMVIDDESRYLLGNMSSSLLELKHLTYLDLSVINFEGSYFPSSIGKLTNLRYLNLSYTLVSGEIPPQIGNLSSLQVLDLGHNYFLTTKSISWVSRLSSLTSLDLSNTNMSRFYDWFQVVNNLSHLQSLKLISCDLPKFDPPSSLSLLNSSNSLSVLDLSWNDRLSVSVYSTVFALFRNLVHLNLDGTNLEGDMTHLSHLDLSNNRLEGVIPESIGNLKSLSHLSLWSNKLGGSIPLSLGTLTSLEYLNLGSNNLEGSIPENLGNLTSLVEIDLSHNELNSTIPKGLGNLSSLRVLDLSYNNLEGEIPHSLWNLCSLRIFQLASNNLDTLNLAERIESSPRCTNYPLQFLNLSQNKFNGGIPETIGQFSQLEDLDLSENFFNGVISEAHFSKLSKLNSLFLSSSSLVFNVSHDWIPPFKLDTIRLDSCKLGPMFPKWLQTQKGYTELYLSNTGISDSIPDWFWEVSYENCHYMDLSNNDIHGTIKNHSFEFKEYPEVKLSSNKLEGPIPRFLFKVGTLNLSSNRFSDLNSLCDVGSDSLLDFLDLSFNQLSGVLPDCWSPFKELTVIVLGNNKLSGKIPHSIGNLSDIATLNLGNNHFTQGLPSSLSNCTKLMAINVGENSLSGTIPTWIGESMSNLVILSLRSNRFFGKIPSQLCHLSNLQLLDLSSNVILGSVPKCIHNLSALKESWDGTGTTIDHPYLIHTSTVNSAPYIMSYDDDVDLVWKGTLSKFSSTLGLVKYIDMSNNKLTGQIPPEITELVVLVFLNLSRNSLSGQIPLDIGKLSLLDTLDLSNNRLSGSIPRSLSQVHRLNTLDLSNNNLSGEIPTSTQLQSFQSASYQGNPQLCGAPLPNSCDRGEKSTAKSGDDGDDDQDGFMSPGFYVSMGMGFVVGFWGVLGTLIFTKTCRYSYLNLMMFKKS